MRFRYSLLNLALSLLHLHTDARIPTGRLNNLLIPEKRAPLQNIVRLSPKFDPTVSDSDGRSHGMNIHSSSMESASFSGVVNSIRSVFLYQASG